MGLEFLSRCHRRAPLRACHEEKIFVPQRPGPGRTYSQTLFSRLGSQGPGRLPGPWGPLGPTGPPLGPTGPWGALGP